MVYQKDAGMDSKVLPSTFWKKKHGDDGDSFGKAANHDDDNHLFTIEHDGGEDDDGHGKGEDKEAQLGGAGLQGVAEDAQALRASTSSVSSS